MSIRGGHALAAPGGVADLFHTSKQNVAKLLKSIFAEAELGAACWLTPARSVEAGSNDAVFVRSGRLLHEASAGAAGNQMIGCSLSCAMDYTPP